MRSSWFRRNLNYLTIILKLSNYVVIYMIRHRNIHISMAQKLKCPILAIIHLFFKDVVSHSFFLYRKLMKGWNTSSCTWFLYNSIGLINIRIVSTCILALLCFLVLAIVPSSLKEVDIIDNADCPNFHYEALWQFDELRNNS